MEYTNIEFDGNNKTKLQVNTQDYGMLEFDLILCGNFFLLKLGSYPLVRVAQTKSIYSGTKCPYRVSIFREDEISADITPNNITEFCIGIEKLG